MKFNKDWQTVISIELKIEIPSTSMAQEPCEHKLFDSDELERRYWYLWYDGEDGGGGRGQGVGQVVWATKTRGRALASTLSWEQVFCPETLETKTASQRPARIRDIDNPAFFENALEVEQISK